VQIKLKARATWTNPGQQLVHISHGRTAFNDRQHSDLTETMPSSYLQAPWIEIEIEAKLKEEAIRKLGERPRTGAIPAS
jgi:UV DNA damage endonuclease